MKSKLIIYYDGICYLCYNIVDFSIKHDSKKEIYYSPLQSNYAKRTLDINQISNFNTVIVKQGDEVFDLCGSKTNLVPYKHIVKQLVFI